METLLKFLTEIRNDLDSVSAVLAPTYREMEHLLVRLCRMDPRNVPQAIVLELRELCHKTPLGQDICYEYSLSQEPDPKPVFFTKEQTTLPGLGKDTIVRELARQLPNINTLPKLSALSDEDFMHYLGVVIQRSNYHYTRTGVSPEKRVRVLFAARLLLQLHHEVTTALMQADAG
ncbi:MAG: hypothetical protein PHV61_06380 [Limnochordia bacterium]|nr:hypothetical protein [Limnochordia bacterium]MDD2629774.1 hypothetical protein [Limnochordia bacterium]MDD4518010.1 hypothetical protein [Limnochordia bacterium]